MHKMSRLLIGLLLTTATGVEAFGQETKVDYNREVRPILAKHCFNCHGPDEKTREAGLRLDVRESAVAIGSSGVAAIVPGKPAESELIKRVTSHDPDSVMPPSEKGASLKEADVSILKKWIEQEAPISPHWAFVPPVREATPVTPDRHWPINGIDAHIQSQLSSLGLQPNELADRYAIIRRLYIDVLGIPPTLEEVDEFVSDSSVNAVERLVDRVLASPTYGERWGAVWLDLARYADSQGYAQDSERTIWRYRDWVIQATNDNMPFDQFTIEQLAGDMLQNPTEDQLVATAFHRNTMTNSEGGTDDEEFRSAAIVDRVNTTMQVWMGMTMACAQCHSHKYDPISINDYFSFYAVFNQSEDRDAPDESPLLTTYSENTLTRKAFLTAEVERLKPLAAEQKRLREANRQAPTFPAEGQVKTKFVRVELLGEQKFLSLAEVELFVGDKNIAKGGKATQSSTGFGGPPELAVDGNTNGDYNVAKSTTHTNQENNPWWEVELTEEAVIEKVVLWNRSDTADVGKRLDNYRVIFLNKDREALWLVASQEPPANSKEFAAATTFGARDAETVKLVEAYAIDHDLKRSEEEMQLAQFEKELAAIKPDVVTPIMRELPMDRQRVTKLQIRGNFRVTGDEVHAGTPAQFPALPDGVPANRLGIAKWLVSSENPLTARVIVNRYWEQIFGTGIVETAEDFGTQGEWPTHPQLLDMLAVDFREQGWDVKRLIRTMVTSATYLQSSAVSDVKREKDPYNRYYASGPRYRLGAETIRDQALAAAGLLSQKMMGPSVRPLRPKLGLSSAFGGSTDWDPSPGEDRYRRGIYTSWRRTTPYPSMTTFDATSREVCTIRRIRTNTPLQALVTLNDPVYVEAAQALGRRAIAETSSEDSARIVHMFRLVLARPPHDAELKVLLKTLDAARAQIAMDKTQAESLATDPIGPAPAGVEIAELAALTLVGNVILNLDETISRR